MSSNLVLALDSSIDFLNLALARGNRLIEERHAETVRHSSEVLPVKVSGLLADHGCTAEDLSAVIVTLGPGSFTGIRTGLAFCKGLAEGLAIPLIGVPTLDALAFPFAFLEGHHLCPLIDAKKGEVFFALFRVTGGKVIQINGYHSLKPDDLRSELPARCLCFGTGARLCQTALAGAEGVRIIQDGFQRISGEALLQYGLARFHEGHREEVRPIYGRRSEAEIRFNIDLS